MLSERSDTIIRSCDRDQKILTEALRETPVDRSFNDLDEAWAGRPIHRVNKMATMFGRAFVMAVLLK